MSLQRLIGLTCLLVMIMAGPTLAQEELRYAGATTLQRYFMPEAARLFTDETGVRVQIDGGNTNPGIDALLKGHIDVAGAGRHLTDEEKAKGLVEHIIGWDVLCVLVHQSNPIANLTQQQIRDIYAGRITGWQSVGGPDQPIVVITYPKGSGMRNAVQALILGEDHYLDQEVISAVVAEGDQQLSLFPMGITALSRSMVDNPGAKVIAVDGVEASPENLENKKFPYAKPLSLVTRGEPQGELAKFIALAKDKRGQNILKKHFVPRFP